jgi:thymidine kinase
MSYLELFIGPMFSGKSTKIIEKYKKYKYLNVNIMIINHSTDIRYNNNSITNHDMDTIPSVMVNKLVDININKELNNTFINSEVILIDEGQFFTDLYDWVKFVLDNYNKNIYIAGLDGDINRNKFGGILDLVPLCDKITKFKSLCSICKNGTKAIFTITTSNIFDNDKSNNDKSNIIAIGGSEMYSAVCRRCYLHYSTPNKQWQELC